MFGFLRKPGARSPSASIRRAIEADGLPLGVDRPSALAVVEQRGRHDGRSVTFIRIFEPAWAQSRGVNVRTFDDLDAHDALILKRGHIERDGGIVITARAPESGDDSPNLEMHDRDDRAGGARSTHAPNVS